MAVKKTAKKAAKKAVKSATGKAKSAKKISVSSFSVIGDDIADAADKVKKAIKKSHVKESFNGSVKDAEEFMKQVMNDSDSLKKFVKIVKKSFSKASSKAKR